MSLTATIVLPTQDRPEYLDVALASIVPQARAAGVPVLVVDDGPSLRTRQVAARHAARYVAHDGPRGLNAARNTAIDHTGSDLLVFVDDDVRVHDGWLAALLHAASQLPDDVGVLTGPIVPVFEDHALRMCGREGAPITFLDHGSADTDVPYAWGANMTIRRSALHRAGRFDASRPLYGDEAQWQDALKAAGGRIRYVAAAGLDHRRAGDDSRLRELSRAAYRRGVASRRHDVFKQRAPTLAAELRTLAGCAVHSLRFRCANGIVMAAHSLGRTHEAWTPQPPAAIPGVDDFLSGQSGTVGGLRGRGRQVRDRLADILTLPARAAARRKAQTDHAHARILVLGVERPGSLMPRALNELRRSGHELTLAVAPVASGQGKFANLNAQLADHDLEAFDWLLVLDDDVTLPAHFLDVLVDQAVRHGLKLAQPAHRLHSHAAWPVTRRHGAGTRAHDLRRDRPRHRSSTATPSRRCCRSRRSCRWAGGSTRTGPRSPGASAGRSASWTPSRSATPWPLPRRPTPGMPRWPKRGPFSRTGRTSGATKCGRWVDRAVKVCVVAEFYPRADDPVLGIWAHRQALAARDAGARGPRAGPATARSRRWRPHAAPAARAARAAAPAPHHDDRRHPGHVRALRLPAAPGLLRHVGPLGRPSAGARAASACAATSPSTSSTPTTPSPRGTRCAAAAWTSRSSSPSTAATSSTPRPARPPGRRPCGRPSPRADLVLANSAGMARDARALDADQRPRRAPGDRPARTRPRRGPSSRRS